MSHSPENLRVLLVDDEEDFVSVMVKRLTKRNLHVVTANGAAQALGLLAEAPFDAVVLDLRMPGTDGLTTLQQIKQVDARTEVIILTGQAELETARRAMSLGAFDYLLKPPDIDDLLYKIQDASLRHAQAKPQTMQ